MSPEIMYCEQQSEEWFNAKLGIPSASHFSEILAKGQGKTRKRYMMRLLAEIMSGQPQETYKNDSMEWGIETEAQARDYYEGYNKVKVEQIGLIKYDGAICSPDGLIEEDGGLEIKCPDTTTHLTYCIENRLPPIYVPQVQGNMYISGRKWWDFISFDPRVQKRPYFQIRIERDEKYINNLKSELKKFINELNELVNEVSCPF